jgi:hypothetical protein
MKLENQLKEADNHEKPDDKNRQNYPKKKFQHDKSIPVAKRL